jgi:SAM-dependent methyltransferase
MSLPPRWQNASFGRNRKLAMANRINLGCGRKYLDGYINCEINPNVKADKYFDLDVFPYPFESDFADEIFLDNVLEHLEDVAKVMSELHRILRVGGIVRIIVPYAKSDWAYQDFTHKHFFTEHSMRYFTEEFGFSYYTHCRFKVLQAKLFCHSTTLRHRLRNLIPCRNILRYFLFNLYDDVFFELMKVKGD